MYTICSVQRFAQRAAVVFCLLCCGLGVRADMPEQVRGVYLTSACFGERRIKETIHYGQHAGLNAVVLHVKDPFGHVHWHSEHATAIEIGAIKGNGRLEKAIKLLNDAGVWTIAKQDLFQDTLLAEKKPEWAVLDTQTGKPWKNRGGLSWANPYDTRVWDYNIALAKELVALGIDEIQFDYIRFPSDGDLSRIRYPLTLEGKDRLQTIGAFLEMARRELKPLGVTISVDLFGFVAWRTDDFGIGQRIEEIAPHADAICPMLYPSHFPTGFLGKKDPSESPKEIMELSVQRLAARTKTAIRPWIQGFWYKPDQVIAQLDGAESAGAESWLIWSPSSNYTVSYAALAKRQQKTLPGFEPYPNLAELDNREPRTERGAGRIVHYTDYKKGRTVLCLEGARDGKASPFGNPSAVIRTLDGAVMDSILKARGVSVAPGASTATSVERVVALMCADLGVSARSVPAHPIRVDWRGDCRFVRTPEASIEEQVAMAAPEGPAPAIAAAIAAPVPVESGSPQASTDEAIPPDVAPAPSNSAEAEEAPSPAPEDPQPAVPQEDLQRNALEPGPVEDPVEPEREPDTAGQAPAEAEPDASTAAAEPQPEPQPEPQSQPQPEPQPDAQVQVQVEAPAEPEGPEALEVEETPTPAQPDTAVEKAMPKEGKAVEPPLSANPPAAFTDLPEFGAIEWTVERLPWVGEGPDAGISGMGMAALNGRIYVCGGFIPGGDGSGDTASHRTSRWTWCYDPKTDRWTRLPDVPVRREYGRAMAAGSAVYLVGGGCQHHGEDPPYRAYSECCRLSFPDGTATWDGHSWLDVPRTHTAAGCAAGYLVVAGGNQYDIALKGYGPGTMRDTTETLNLAGGKTWEQRSPMPGAPRGWTASAATAGELYVFGGLTWSEAGVPIGTRETLCYCPKTDTWIKLTPPPAAVSGWAGALYNGRFAILVGGVERRNGAVLWSDLVWVYDTRDDIWMRVDDSLPPGAVFNDPGVACIGDKIYVAGAEGPHGSHYNYFLVGAIKLAPHDTSGQDAQTR